MAPGGASGSRPERPGVMRILLTGASGLVGSNVAVAAHRRGHQVHGLTGTWTGPMLPGLRSTARIDLAHLEALTAAVLEFFPDAIINAAAFSEIARCEADPDGSRVLNVRVPARLAEIAHHLGCRFVHISSDQVFDGTRAPYSFDDPTAPRGAYAVQKVESEKAVVAAAPDYAAIVRAPLLLGNSAGGRRSVHERLLADWAAGRTTRLFTDEIRQPCTADNLADVLVELCERPDLKGVFHWGGADRISRHELGSRIAAHFGFVPDGRIEAGTLAGSPLAGSRPANLSMDLRPLAGLLKTRVQSLDEQLDGLGIPVALRSWWASLPK